MAIKTVGQFASELKMQTASLIEQLKAAGIAKEQASDPMSEADKTRLLDYLRKAHGSTNPKQKIVLSRRNASESGNDNGVNGLRTIEVEVRKKRVFVKYGTVGERYLVIDGIFERSVLGVFRIVRGFANLQDLAEISVPYEMEETDDAVEIVGQQRKLDTQHAERIKRYLESGEQRFLPEVILSVRTEVDDELDKLQTPIGVRTKNNDDGIAIQKKWKAQENSVHQISIDRQKLNDILAKKLIRRLDGNHRLALASTLQTDPHLATKYLAPFCIVLLGPEGDEADDYSESLIFHTINSTALPLESEHALKLILGQNADYDMAPEKEFAYSPDLHFTRLLRDGLLKLPKPVHTRLGDHPLTSLRGAVRGLLDMDPKIASDLATLRKYSKALVAALSDIVTRLEPSQPSLCKAEFFIELAARVWKASPGDGDHNTRVNAAVAELEQLAAWLGKDGLLDLREGRSLSKQVLDIFTTVRKRIPKNVLALLMLARDKSIARCLSQEQSGIQSARACPVDGSIPAKVAVQVFGGHAFEAANPALESAVIGIHVLDVIDAGDDTDASGQIDRAVRDADLLGARRQGAGTIRAKDGVLTQNGLQGSGDVLRIAARQDEVGSCAGTIPTDQHRNLFFGSAALGGLSAPLARCAGEPALPLVRLQEECLIGFRDTHQNVCLQAFRQRKEAMAPAERRLLGDVQARGSLVERQPITQGGRLFEPLALHPQSRQRRAGQRVESLRAVSALESLQPVGRSILDDLPAGAMRAVRHLASTSLDHLNRRRLALAGRKLRNHTLPLRPRQFPQTLHQSCQLSLSHVALLASAPSRYEAQYVGGGGSLHEPVTT